MTALAACDWDLATGRHFDPASGGRATVWRFQMGVTASCCILAGVNRDRPASGPDQAHTQNGVNPAPARGADPAELLSLVYAQLRAVADRALSAERTGHTLTATALVHEAYLKLANGRRTPWESEAQFFVAAAEAMRQILIDHARARGRVKRGGGRGPRQRLPLSVIDLAVDTDPDQVIELDALINRLEVHHPSAAEVVRLRFYAGLSIKKTAEILDQSPWQVGRHWSFARAWLYRALSEA